MSESEMSRKIKDLRAKHDLTLEEIAQQVGVGRSTVRKWETGQIQNMRRDKIAKLAAALHTTPEYLMGWDEEKAIPIASERKYDDSEIMFALSRGGEAEITDEMFEEVKNFARFIAQREAMKKNKKE